MGEGLKWLIDILVKEYGIFMVVGVPLIYCFKAWIDERVRKLIKDRRDELYTLLEIVKSKENPKGIETLVAGFTEISSKLGNVEGRLGTLEGRVKTTESDIKDILKII